MLKAIAIDDEPIALEVIKQFAEQVKFIEMNGYFTNPFDALSFLQSNSVDLLFLDIKMPNISGIDFLKSLSDAPLVIYTTAYSEHAVQSFELDVVDYLLKPFSFARFLKACNKSLSQFEFRRSTGNFASGMFGSIFVKSGYEQIRLELGEVLYAEGKGNYVQFVTDKLKILSRLTMIDAEKLLPAATFVRIHRSYIVSKSKISKIDRYSVWVNKTELPIGPGYANGVESLFKSP